MKAELPELKKCCFCIPLRPGLLVWGYLRLVFLALVMTSLILILAYYGRAQSMHFGTQIVYMLVTILDACLTIVYLIGGHQRNAKLLYVSFIGNIVLLCIHTLLFISASWNQLHELGKLHIFDRMNSTKKLEFLMTVFQGFLGMGTFTLGTVAYVIILLHSEINKIKKHSNYRVANTAVEVENGTTEYGFTLKETNTEQ